MTTFLQIFVPLIYFVIGLTSMRYVSTRPNLGDSDWDANFAAVPLGIFWPLTMPIFFMLYKPPKRQAQFEINRKVAEQDKKEVMTEFAKINRPQITDGRDHNRPWD